MKKLRSLIYGLAEIIFGMNWLSRLEPERMSTDMPWTLAFKTLCILCACVFIWKGTVRTNNSL